MSQTPSPLSTFHLTGQMSGKDLFDIGQRDLRPALFSAYGDLSKLRYDYPVLLIKGSNGASCMRSLSDIVTDILRNIAPPGIDGERLRKHVLNLEDEIRALAGDGHKGTLTGLWELAAANLLSQTDGDSRKTLDDSLTAARNALSVDGEIVNCDDDTPNQFLTHAWTAVQEQKTLRFSGRLDDLTLKLSNILKADAMKSETAFGPDSLRQAVGSSYEDAFDFESMSDILGTSLVDGALPEKRRRRIRSVLSTLKSQEFFPQLAQNGKKRRRKDLRGYVFDRCGPAMEALRERMPKMVDFIKAMTIAQLEIEGRYRESAHDPFFRGYDERYLEPSNLAFFPSYLICLRDDPAAKTEMADLIEALSSGLPIKVLVKNDDILEELSIGSGQLSFGVRGSQLASMALGLDGVFVLQSSSADLYRLRDSILSGLAHSGPALFSVFSGRARRPSGSTKNAPDTPLYLRAAAATESRAFPVFVHDPAGGRDWESRFSVDNNPRQEADWPTHQFDYEDENLQKISEVITFTFVDFAAIDERYAKHFAGVPRAEWQDVMVPVNEFLELDVVTAAEKVPYILMVDGNNLLHRVIVEVRLIHAARRCSEMWRSLRELGGIDNSHASKAVAAEKEIWEHEKELELAAMMQRPEEPGSQPPETAPLPPPPDQEPDATAGATEPTDEEFPSPPSDEPRIETPRCTTCDECTQINNRMFIYDDNKQAYIADLKAGTYRQLVEAAESCQVAIIHPGKPINPDEPNLDELMERAEPFN
jgi:hypothetical protein